MIYCNIIFFTKSYHLSLVICENTRQPSNFAVIVHNVDSNCNILRKGAFEKYSMFTYDGQTTCLPFFPFFADFPSLAVVSWQQDSSNSTQIIGLNPPAMVPKNRVKTGLSKRNVYMQKSAKTLTITMLPPWWLFSWIWRHLEFCFWKCLQLSFLKNTNTIMCMYHTLCSTLTFL